jgi:hypothetical protein
MSKMATKNSNLHTAKKMKNDEFYTQLTDIENELKHYKEHFRNKVVYCNCDDPIESNFFKYFSLNFEHLGLKKLISTGYKENGKGIVYIYEGDKNGNRMPDLEEIEVKELQGNGDFRSAECLEFLKESDIVVTNPPFSLFRDYVATLIEYGKQYLIIGSQNAITYKEIFPLIKDNKMWLGVNSVKEFIQPNGEIKKFGNICWFTNLDHKKRNYPLDLYMKYSNDYYPKYDNYDAIEVSKVCEIPMDYEGVMGVPITFLHKYNPEQFEILDARNYTDNVKLQNKSTYLIKDKDGAINGKATYARILIRHKK